MPLRDVRRLMCAEAYALGDWGDNACPPNAERIGSAAACEHAAASMGKEWARSLDDGSDSPSGCSWTQSGKVYFNPNPVGGGVTDTLPLCTAGAAPAPSQCGAACLVSCVACNVHAVCSPAL